MIGLKWLETMNKKLERQSLAPISSACQRFLRLFTRFPWKQPCSRLASGRDAVAEQRGKECLAHVEMPKSRPPKPKTIRRKRGIFDDRSTFSTGMLTTAFVSIGAAYLPRRYSKCCVHRVMALASCSATADEKRHSGGDEAWRHRVGDRLRLWKSAGRNRIVRIVGGVILAHASLGFLWPFAAMHQREVLAAGGATLSNITVFLLWVVVLATMLWRTGTAQGTQHVSPTSVQDSRG
jgi:hypothetical protein